MNQPTPAPTSSLQPQQPPMSAEVHQLMREKANLCQMLWELVRLHSPETETVELPATASSPLWQLAFVRGSEGKVKLMAGLHVGITEQEKKRVVRFLRGTSKKAEEATIAFELPHPANYVEQQISDHLVWKDGAWVSVTPAKVGEKLKNAVLWPK